MPKQYPRELRERAVRLVIEHRGDYATEYAAIRSIAARLGIATAETLRQWVRQAEVDSGQWAVVSSEESARTRPPSGAGDARCSADGRDHPGVEGESGGLRSGQGLAGAQPRRYRPGLVHHRAADA